MASIKHSKLSSAIFIGFDYTFDIAKAHFDSSNACIGLKG